mgnify:CR=1 FL=1
MEPVETKGGEIMSKFKIGVWAVVFVLILLFFLHNQAFFMTKNTFDINVFGIPSLSEYSSFFNTYETPPLPNIVIFIGFFLLGVLVTYFFYIFGWMKSKRVIKRLSCDCESLHQKVDELESELAMARGGGPARKREVDAADEAEMAAMEDSAAGQALKKK